VNIAIKYSLARIGLFLAAFLILLPVPISWLLKLALALIISGALSYFVLRGWREQYSLSIQHWMEHRKTEKNKLRSALAGDDEPDDPTDSPSDKS
jgi:hypothetical protein